MVKAVAPLLISQQALTNMQGRMDFPTFTLELPNRVTIRLAKSATGHVLLHGIIKQKTLVQLTRDRVQVFHAQQAIAELRKFTDDEVLKTHLQVGHCSEKQLVGLLKFGGCKVDPMQIQRIAHNCNCQRSAHRIAPPVVSSWVARFSGEVVAVDIIRPFGEVGPEGLFPLWKATGGISALLVVDSLTRFISCQIAKNLTSEVVAHVFMIDWAQRSGKPKRIILDQGGPGMGGRGWGDLSRIFGWRYIRAPTRAPHQNGLAERPVRSLKATAQSIVRSGNRSHPSQALLALAVIAKNHAPHAATGIPPDFAMTGRCDVASGASTCMCGARSVESRFAHTSNEFTTENSGSTQRGDPR